VLMCLCCERRVGRRWGAGVLSSFWGTVFASHNLGAFRCQREKRRQKKKKKKEEGKRRILLGKRRRVTLFFPITHAMRC
jgi:hypothetical protein